MYRPMDAVGCFSDFRMKTFATATVFCVLLSVHIVFGDTPANCTYENTRGRWIFETCSHPLNCHEKADERFVVDLLFPNIVNVISGYGTIGHWTMIYNQGFEVTVAHRKWLVMFAYDSRGVSKCAEGIPNWTHDSLVRQWRWFSARKMSPIISEFPASPNWNSSLFNELYQTDHKLIDAINSVQSSWKAVHYPFWDKLNFRDIIRRTGGIKSVFHRPQDLIDRTRNGVELVHAVKALPETFDWRFPAERRPSPVTPVRNQFVCGSCYAFASTAALESRIRIMSNFTHQPILSPQSIVDCSPYSEGCDGGFPYLIAGKYAEDYGIPIEACDPYTGVKASTCPVKANCSRYYATNYHYVGGYYGACSELMMKIELVNGGPIPVGFQVYEDFMYYRSGVYKHINMANSVKRFEPFELTNHAVLLVGYGVDKVTNLPYWSIKNSWGTQWGEHGFFRILRGVDECSIESLAVAFDPVL